MAKNMEALRFAGAICDVLGIDKRAISELTLDFKANGLCEVITRGYVWPEDDAFEQLKTFERRFTLVDNND